MALLILGNARIDGSEHRIGRSHGCRRSLERRDRLAQTAFLNHQLDDVEQTGGR
jgi:hypothetical protein